MEFAESDLKKILKSSIHLEILHIQTIIYNLLCAIKYLHESKVIHRDLKPANVLINEDCSVKLCDYGLARSITGVESAEMILKQAEKEETIEQADDSMAGGSSKSLSSLSLDSKGKEETKKDENKKDDMRSRLLKTKD